MLRSLIKSILHNVGVLFVSFCFGYIGILLDMVFHVLEFHQFFYIFLGIVFLFSGFLIRVWATYYFYLQQMRVIVLHPQKKLITEGPYRFSRNPLYLGGNVCMFFGASLVLGTPSGVVLMLLQLLLTDWMIRREERQLAKKFGKQWMAYAKHVPRWL